MPLANSISGAESKAPEEPDSGAMGARSRRDQLFRGTPHGRPQKRKRSLSDMSLGEKVLVRPRFEAVEEVGQVDFTTAATASLSTTPDRQPLRTSGDENTTDPGEVDSYTKGADQPSTHATTTVPDSNGEGSASDPLCPAAESLAHELDDRCQIIWSGEHPWVALNPGICGSRSLRLLASDGRLTDELVDTVPLLGVGSHNHAYLLPSAVYTNISERRWKALDRWKIRPGERWIFGIQETNHWMAVKIDWKDRLIQSYDPMERTLSRRGKRILGSMKRVKKWTEHLRGAGGPWVLGSFHGPQQHADDVQNCGFYVAWVLRAWIQGHPAGEDTLEDLLGFRQEVFRLLQDAPRAPALPMVDNSDSESSASGRDEKKGDAPASRGWKTSAHHADARPTRSDGSGDHRTTSGPSRLRHAREEDGDDALNSISREDPSADLPNELSGSPETVNAVEPLASGGSRSPSVCIEQQSGSIDTRRFEPPDARGQFASTEDHTVFESGSGVTGQHFAAAGNGDANVQMQPPCQTSDVKDTASEFPLTPFLREANEMGWDKYIEEFDWD
ncbi:hypothetical protein LTR87_017270 [Friedmanniomyces endolithicus]|nr:hypothetical protein LTR87_017270 [Friedmanniomyces endolithicus]